MRMSSLFLKTLREDPADAEVPSHRLLVRAGYVRRVAPGIFTWLPMGLLVLRNVERVLREEMASAGAQELHFPALLPKEPYEATGRWDEYGPNLFRLQDRKGADYLLGPTHEEMFTLTVKAECSSYKDLPLTLFQIQNKYRDEARPRAGILRGREFVMKDAYSFDVTDEGLQKSYDAQRAAYQRFFDRIGLDYVIVSAMSGAMGGSKSEEFLAASEFGEDTYVRSTSGAYAANVEAVTTPVPPAVDASGVPAMASVPTPKTTTIDKLVAHLNEKEPREDGRAWTAADTLKNVLFVLEDPDGTSRPLAIGVPGDRDVDLKRVEAVVSPAEVRAFEDDDFKKYPGLKRGYIGPWSLRNEKIEWRVDPRVVDGTRWVTGADEWNTHVKDFVFGRDYSDPVETIEAAEVREGDASPDGDGTLTIARGIEIGHIFQLGRKYAEALDLKVLDENGKQVVVTMGSYGIGVTRAVAAVAEQRYDEYGLVWPRSIAPADVHLVATGKDAAVFEAAEVLAADLDARGVRVLFDDRQGVSPGVKFKDAELLGVPTIVVVGKGLADGVVEVKDRASGERENVAVADAAAHIKAIISA